MIGLVDCSTVTTDNDTGAVEPTARIRRLEVVTHSDDLANAEVILRRALDDRLGATVLPLAIEDDITGAFADQIDTIHDDLDANVDDNGEVIPFDREVRDAMDTLGRLGLGPGAPRARPRAA